MTNELSKNKNTETTNGNVACATLESIVLDYLKGEATNIFNLDVEQFDNSIDCKELKVYSIKDGVASFHGVYGILRSLRQVCSYFSGRILQIDLIAPKEQRSYQGSWIDGHPAVSNIYVFVGQGIPLIVTKVEDEFYEITSNAFDAVYVAQNIDHLIVYTEGVEPFFRILFDETSSNDLLADNPVVFP